MEFDNLTITRVGNVEKKLSVRFDMEKGQYIGLPTLWRELLDMPLSVSKDEVETSDWDTVVSASMPTRRVMFMIEN
jgi:hypothetical protein